MEITINSITFTLIKKIQNRDYILVEIESIVDKTKNTFYVYPSNSELGIWRLCSYQRNKIYKGCNITTFDYTFDYVQSTLIHVELQLFINKNINQLSLVQEELYPDYKLYRDIINSPSRQIHLPPFITFQEILQCGQIASPYESKVQEIFGEISNDPFTLINAFANKLSQNYNIDEKSIIEEGDYVNLFQNIIEIKGVIKSVILYKKDIDLQLKLYFLEVRFTKQMNIDTEITSEMHINIDKLCTEGNIHFMPFLLTLPNVTCNEFGLHNYYIPCGSFVCKLFDYSNESQQCSKEEIACGKVTPLYSYIGSRYNRIFPFVELMKHVSPIKTVDLQPAILPLPVSAAAELPSPKMKSFFENDKTECGGNSKHKNKKNMYSIQRRNKIHSYRKKVKKRKTYKKRI